jgi:hypothetical protein
MIGQPRRSTIRRGDDDFDQASASEQHAKSADLQLPGGRRGCHDCLLFNIVGRHNRCIAAVDAVRENAAAA